METSLLKTKLNIPPLRPQLVSRPKLVDRLNEGLNYSLILVSAPAGFGKTTLLSEWVRQNQPDTRAAWFSLDEGDNDPTRFWSYFIAALQNIQPACGEKILPLLHSSRQPAFEQILTVLINDLAEIEDDFVVVLDDYHLVNSQSVHDSITYLLEHIPAKMHLIIATRADPSLPLARLRGRGTMLEIGADDLRFTLEDTTSLLREMKIPEISVGDVVTLNERTEGWVAGLVMAALSMRGQKDIPAFITAFTGSQRYVMDYLVEEVLNKQSEEIRDFLLKTSILERLSGALCDAVTGNKGSQDILLNLEHSHLFIVPLDESRQWYRYEHLFADLLRHQCESVYGTEQVTSLHRLAWQWYQDNNLPDEAIHHALKTQDWDRAVVLITEYGEKKRQIGEFVTLLKWTQQIPEKVLISQPVLCLNHAGAMSMAGSLDTAESILKKLEKTVQSDDSLVGRIAASRAFLAWRRFDFPLAEELAKKALSLLPSSEIVQRDFMSLTLGLLYYIHGNYIEDEPIFTRAYEIAVRLKNYFGASSAFGGLMSIFRLKGKLR